MAMVVLLWWGIDCAARCLVLQGGHGFAVDGESGGDVVAPVVEVRLLRDADADGRIGDGLNIFDHMRDVRNII
jgi:hypothetical protein